jgi:serine/threonine protein kinase/tetratricopeptide (TPR) repeat protein
MRADLALKTEGRAVNERDIFIAAVQIADPAERAAYLDQACAGEPELRHRACVLLNAFEQAGSFLQQPADPKGTSDFPPLQPSVAGNPDDLPGTIIGPYKLLQQIGEGGMGTVYMAEQTEPVQRKVALKIIKPGMDSRQVIARFEAERQALALMDHPNIAKVLDAGTTGPNEGRPYFVMELVKGVPITRYCDEHHLTPRQRLELFVQVCHAVQHAHQKGIIHRDLKPSNVMVSPYDGKPVPKVIDFGVAKAAGPKLTERTLFTELGQVIGTLEYMSPEQAELNQLDIDTRSDIYSLGVLLYELLTGTTPLERKRLKEVAVLELLRLVREEEAPRPSTRLSTAEGLPSIAANRGTEPKKLTGLMRGELDWIVMKSLEKDRDRRYETANGLAHDIERYLNDEAVQACPPSTAYRFRKFVRRNKAVLATAVVVAAALLIGIAVATWQAVRATKAEGLAQEQRHAADTNFEAARKAVDDYFTVISGSPVFDTPGMEPLRKQLLETALRYNLEFIQQRSDDPKLQADVAASHLRVGEITYLVGGDFDQWFPRLRDGVNMISQMIATGRDTPEVQQRLARIRLLLGIPQVAKTQTPDNEAVFRCLRQHAHNLEKFIRDNPDVAEFQDSLAGLSLYLGQAIFDGSETVSLSNRAIDIWEKLKREHPEIPSYRVNLARAYELRGDITAKTTRTPQMDEDFEKALLLRRELVRETPDKATHRVWLAASYRSLGETQNTRNQPKEAEKTLRQALDLQEKLVAEFSHVYQAELAQTQLALGDALKKLGRSEEAQATYRQALGCFERLVVAFPKVDRYQRLFLRTAKDLAQLLEASGHPQKKREVLDVVFAVYEKLAAASPQTPEDLKRMDQAAHSSKTFDDLSPMALFYENLGNLLGDIGQSKESEKVYAKALTHLNKAIEQQPDRWEAWHWRGRYYFSRQLWDKALADFSKAIELNPQRDNPGLFSDAWHKRGWTYVELGQVDKGVRDFTTAIELAPGSFWHWLRRAQVYAKLQQWPKTVADCSRAIELKADFAEPWQTRGDAHAALGQLDKALADYAKAIALSEKLPVEFPMQPSYRAETGWTCRKLASLLVKLPNRFKDAEETHAKDVSTFGKLAAEFSDNPSWPEQLAHGHRQWAFDLRGMNRPQEAEKSFRKAIKVLESSSTKFPNAVPSHSALLADTAGVLARMLGRWEEAEQAYSKLLELAPQSAVARNNLAWLLATCPEPKFRDAQRAITSAKKATELAPKEGNHWNTLGAAYYYAGDWKAAIAALQKSMELRRGGDSFDWFFLAMARWQLGDKKDARKWYDQAVQWMEKNQPKNEELSRFRAEAETLLKIETQPMVK